MPPPGASGRPCVPRPSPGSSRSRPAPCPAPTRARGTRPSAPARARPSRRPRTSRSTSASLRSPSRPRPCRRPSWPCASACAAPTGPPPGSRRPGARGRPWPGGPSSGPAGARATCPACPRTWRRCSCRPPARGRSATSAPRPCPSSRCPLVRLGHGHLPFLPGAALGKVGAPGEHRPGRVPDAPGHGQNLTRLLNFSRPRRSVPDGHSRHFLVNINTARRRPVSRAVREREEVLASCASVLGKGGRGGGGVEASHASTPPARFRRARGWGIPVQFPAKRMSEGRRFPKAPLLPRGNGGARSVGRRHSWARGASASAAKQAVLGPAHHCPPPSLAVGRGPGHVTRAAPLSRADCRLKR